MEEVLASILGILMQHGIIADTSLLFIIIGILCLLYFYIFKQLKEKLHLIPTFNDLKNLIDEDFKLQGINLTELNNKLVKVVDTLDDIEDLNKDCDERVQELKKDLEIIKQILVQFQGHLMYSPRNNFDNRELR